MDAVPTVERHTSLNRLALSATLLCAVALRHCAVASDTVSITVMEIVDNIVVLAIPGAMEAGLGEILFWGSLTLSLLVAAVVAFPVVRWLIARNQGHAVVHQFHARGAGSQSAHH